MQYRDKGMNNKFRDGRSHKGLVVEVVHDDFGRALRNWSKKVQDSGMLKIVKDKMGYEKPAVERQRMKKQARKRWERTVEEMIEGGQWLKDKKY